MYCQLSIEKLLVRAPIGVFEQERAVGNDFAVTVTLRYDFLEAARSDSLAGTVNYAEVIDIIKAVMAEPRQLIESAAWTIREALLKRWPAIAGGSVAVTKLHPPVSAQLAGCTATISW